MIDDKQLALIMLPAGSPQTGEPAFLVVGKLRRPHGLQGEMVFEIITDFPERLVPGVKVFVGDFHQPHLIRSRRASHNALLIALDPIDDLKQSSDLRNQLVYVHADDRPPLPEGEYYHHQLIGLHVISDDEQNLGCLTQILDTGANDVYVVRRDNGKEILLPALRSVILDIDLAAGRMVVHLLPGLIPE